MNYDNLMSKVIDLAKLGKGNVSPNPLVGSIIVENGEIISQGYHKRYGETHAEVNAINNAGNRDFSAATIIVNLEPCSHYGKTPPCVDLIIEKQFKKVVIGMQDPNPLVSGRGIKKLRNAGIEVIEGILGDKCKQLNRSFITNITKNRPYSILKIAQSIDGKIATSTGESRWISSEESRKYVHKLRSDVDAVLIGKNTVKFDNPLLNVRWIKGKNPKKVILDTNLELEKEFQIFQKNIEDNVIICCSQVAFETKHSNKELFSNIHYLPIDSLKNHQINLDECLNKLYTEFNIGNLLIEGGSEVFTSFIENHLVDEIHFMIAPKIIGRGKSSFDNLLIDKLSSAYKFKFLSPEQIGEDLHLTLTKKDL